MATKGSAVLSTLIVLTMVIVVFLIFLQFQRGTFVQASALTSKGIEATGDIPCSRAPTISIVPVTPIRPPTKDNMLMLPFKKSVLFNATISSSCFENLSILWDLGGTISEETICQYPYTADNCSTFNYTLNVQPEDIWRTIPVRVSAFGMRSGFFTEDNGVGFVEDPLFGLVNTAINPNDFSCVQVSTNIRAFSSGTFARAANEGFEVKDDSKIKDAEGVNVASPYTITYRADQKNLGTHTVTLRAKYGYQYTPEVKVSYEPKILLNKDEFVSMMEKQILTYTAAGNNFFNNIYHPNALKNTDVAVGDLDNDGVDDIVFLISSPEDGIFAMPFSEYKSSYSKTFYDMEFKRLKEIWPYASLVSKSWKAVAIGKNIMSPDDERGNIVLLGTPGDLDLYRYSVGQLTMLERGSEFTDKDWTGFTTYDLDDDNEDEIIAIRSGDIYFFKYKNYKNLKDAKEGVLSNVDYSKNVYWKNLEDKSWKAVAVGEMDGDENTVEIVILGGAKTDGDLALYIYDRKGHDFANRVPGGGWRSDWPDKTSWNDVTTVWNPNTNRYDLAFLYNADMVLVTSWEGIMSSSNFDNDMYNLTKWVDDNKYGYDWQTITGTKRLSAGDLACA